eukprot:scaffold2097_cov403-Prasinococcus_capsulatus_cf.AAC.11
MQRRPGTRLVSGPTTTKVCGEDKRNEPRPAAARVGWPPKGLRPRGAARRAPNAALHVQVERPAARHVPRGGPTSSRPLAPSCQAEGGPERHFRPLPRSTWPPAAGGRPLTAGGQPGTVFILP